MLPVDEKNAAIQVVANLQEDAEAREAMKAELAIMGTEEVQLAPEYKAKMEALDLAKFKAMLNHPEIQKFIVDMFGMKSAPRPVIGKPPVVTPPAQPPSKTP